MDCDQVFSALAAGEPGPDEQAIRDHLDGCADCRADADGVAAFKHALKHPDLYEKDPPHVRDAIMKVAFEKADELRLRSRPAWARNFAERAAVVATTVFLLGGGFVTGRGTLATRNPSVEELVIEAQNAYARGDFPTVDACAQKLDLADKLVDDIRRKERQK